MVQGLFYWAILSRSLSVIRLGFRFMVLSVTFNNISALSWRSVLLVEETGVPGENHRPVANASRHERGSNSHL